MLSIIVDVTRKCLRKVPDTSIAGCLIVREISDLMAEPRKPGMTASDNGSELTSNAVLAWCGAAGVEWHLIAPSKPMQNGFCERYYDRMRD